MVTFLTMILVTFLRLSCLSCELATAALSTVSISLYDSSIGCAQGQQHMVHLRTVTVIASFTAGHQLTGTGFAAPGL
jgi:hypothetical protein